MTTTVGDEITTAMRLLNLLDQTETPDSTQLAIGLTAFNQMVDSWNTERLSVYSTQDQTFTWPASQRVRTLGPTGNFVGTRPVFVDDSSYYIQPGTGISYSFSMLNDDQYNAIALKTATSTLPTAMWVNYTMPDITIYVYPVPTIDLQFHFISVEKLSQATATTDTIVLPPGYLRAFSFNLAVEMAPLFGVDPTPRVMRIADTAKRNIKRINNPDDLMGMPGTIMRNWMRFNVYAGNF